MAKSALSKLVKAFNTPQHDYKLNTQIFGQFDADKVAKELNLEEIGAEKGKKNQPAADSQIPDEIETQILERIEAQKSKAHDAAVDQIHLYNERIASLDFEGHFSDLRRTGPLAISEIQARIHLGLNQMYPRRNKLLNEMKAFDHFRKENGLEYKTAKITSNYEKTLRILIIVILIFSETYFNATYLAKGSTQGLIGGIIEAASFTLLNIGFSIIITHFVIKQIVRRGLFWKFLGLTGIAVWLILIIGINLALAHYREVASTFLEGAGADILARILNSPLGLTELESWMLFATAMLFATIALVDILTFSDIYPGYTRQQKHFDEVEEDYINEFESLKEVLDEIKEDYEDNLNEIGNALTSRQRELVRILSGLGKLKSLYNAHHEQLQRASDALFSYYFQANREARTEPPPERFNNRNMVIKMELTSDKALQDSATKKINRRIAEAKKFLEKQIESVLDEYLKGIHQYQNLDIINIKFGYGEETKKKVEEIPQ